MPESPENPKTVHFTIDRRPFSTEQREQTAGALLKLAGLDPEGYNLGDLRPGQAEPKVFEDGHPVHVHEGEKFVSIRESAPVA